MSSANPYAAPRSDVNAEATGAIGSVEDAVAGRYDFEIGEVMRDAWRLTHGFKLTFWGAWLILTIGSWVVTAILGVGINLLKLGTAGQVLLQVISLAIGFALGMGLVMLFVRRAAGLRADIGTAFSYFDRWLNAILGGFLFTLAVLVGTILLVIPGIYLAVAGSLCFQLIGDRRMGPWQALETSRKALTHRWGKIFLTGLATGLLTLLSALLIIPLFWTVPWLYLVSGVLYRRIFGVATTA